MLAEINWTPILGGGVVGVIVSAVTGYLLAVRRFSGEIDTSEAQQLWNEARAIRDDQRVKLDRSDERSLSLEIRVAKLEDRNNDLTTENLHLRAEVEECKRLGERMRERIAELEAELKGAT